MGIDPKLVEDREKYCKEVKRVTEKKIHETKTLERLRNERVLSIQEARKAKEMEIEAQRVYFYLRKF
jgi:hypothetical protein